MISWGSAGALLCPFVLLSDLGFLFRGEVVDDAELLPNLLRRFTYFTINLPLIIVATLAQHSSIKALMSR